MNKLEELKARAILWLSNAGFGEAIIAALILLGFVLGSALYKGHP